MYCIVSYCITLYCITLHYCIVFYAVRREPIVKVIWIRKSSQMFSFNWLRPVSGKGRKPWVLCRVSRNHQENSYGLFFCGLGLQATSPHIPRQRIWSRLHCVFVT